MDVDANLSQEIVNNLKEIVHHEINFISTQGIIIASTDFARIGTIHEGAQEVIKNADFLVVNHDGQFEGAKKGINVPVYVNNKIVAVIGITGAGSEMIEFSKVIKNMTEILIKENWLSTIRFNSRYHYQLLIDEISINDSNLKAIYDLRSILDVDLTIPRFFISGTFYQRNGDSLHDVDHIYMLIDGIVQNGKKSFFSVSSNSIKIALNAPNINICESICKNISNKLLINYGVVALFGIGSEANTINYLHKSYQESMIALKWNSRIKKISVIKYDELDLGLLFSQLSAEEIRLYIQEIFKNLSTEEFNEYKEVFLLYEKHNGSIYKCANDMYIHKNTFQYKLKTFRQKTGLDFRNLKDYVLIALAFKLSSFSDSLELYFLEE